MTRSARRRFARGWRRYPTRGIVVLFILGVLAAVRLAQHQGEPYVRRVVDGDTLLLTDGTRIRLIGADTPETVKRDSPIEAFGPEATEFTKQFVARAGGRVRLEYDRERVDRYGRTLAYVYVGDEMLNEELIRHGLATAQTQYNYSRVMKDRFRRAEEEAKAAGRGRWSLDQPAAAP
jgi:micrococcal nuclease